MKRFLAILAVTALVAVSGLGFECNGDNGEPDLGNFSIEVLGDSIKTDTLGASVNFNFTLRNHTGNTLTLTVDVPEDLLDYPEGWWHSLCDEGACYPTSHDFDVAANGSLEGLHVTVTSATDGTEGSIVVEVSAGEEVDRQTFILQK